MKPLRMLAAISLAIFLFSSFSAVQAQKRKPRQPLPMPPAVPAPPATTLEVIVQNQDNESPGRIAVKVSADVTKVRIVGETTDYSFSKDTKKQKSFVVDVDLNHGDNSFNIIAYKDNAIVYYYPEPVIVSNSIAATGKKPKPVPPKDDKDENDGEQGGEGEDEAEKITLTKAAAVTDKAAYELGINLDSLATAKDKDCAKGKTCDFNYVIELKNGEKTTFYRKTIKDASNNKITSKDTKPKADQKETITLVKGDNTIAVYAEFGKEIAGTRSKEFKVTYSTEPPKDDPKKVQIKSPPKLTNQATYTANINLAKEGLSAAKDCPEGTTPPCSYQYVIKTTAKNGDVRTKRVKIKRLEDKKEVDLTTKAQDPLKDQKETIALFEGENTLSVYAEYGSKIEGSESDAITVNCENCSDSGSSVNTRAIVGFEQIGASSADSEQHPFLDFFFNAPFHVSYGRKPGFKKSLGFSVWGNIRFSNIPVQNLASFATFNPVSAAGLFSEDGGKPNKLTPSFNALVGIDKPIFNEEDISMGFLPGRSAVSLIVGVGAINLLKPDKTTQTFKVPKVGAEVLPAFLSLYPEADPDGQTTPGTPIDNIAFVPVDREKFYRQYYAGIRIRTFFYDENGQPRNLFPALVDLTLGQNEAVTKYLRGVILKLDGSTPLPIKGNDFLYVYGGLQLKLGKYRPRPIPGFFELEPADPSTATNTNTIFVASDRAPGFQVTRDVFRIGVGIDLFRIFRSQQQ